MITTETVEMVFPVAREKLFETLTGVVRMAEWSPEVIRSRWIGDNECAAIGARFRGISRVGLAVWYKDATITELRPPELFEFRTQGNVIDPGETTWTFELHEHPDGTLIRQTYLITKPPGRLAVALARLNRRDPSRVTDMRATLESLARTARHEPPIEGSVE